MLVRNDKVPFYSMLKTLAKKTETGKEWLQMPSLIKVSRLTKRKKEIPTIIVSTLQQIKITTFNKFKTSSYRNDIINKYIYIYIYIYI